MKTQAIVELINPRSGGLILHAADGSYVLAQQIDVKPLRVAQVLSGEADNVGMEIFTDPQSGIRYDFFIEAYGLSRDAALASLH